MFYQKPSRRCWQRKLWDMGWRIRFRSKGRLELDPLELPLILSYFLYLYIKNVKTFLDKVVIKSFSVEICLEFHFYSLTPTFLNINLWFWNQIYEPFFSSFLNPSILISYFFIIASSICPHLLIYSLESPW